MKIKILRDIKISDKHPSIRVLHLKKGQCLEISEAGRSKSAMISHPKPGEDDIIEVSEVSRHVADRLIELGAGEEIKKKKVKVKLKDLVDRYQTRVFVLQHPSYPGDSNVNKNVYLINIDTDPVKGIFEEYADVEMMPLDEVYIIRNHFSSSGDKFYFSSGWIVDENSYFRLFF